MKLTRQLTKRAALVLLMFLVPVGTARGQAAPAVALAPAAKQQFFTTTGTPLAGGLIYAYQSGTRTPLATHNDRTGQTQNSNPVFEVYNVMAYGATGSCTTDDTSAISSAITGVPSGGTLFFPVPSGGCYLVSSTFTLSKLLHFVGAIPVSDYSQPMIKTTSATAYVLDFESGSEGSTVEGLELYTSASSPTAGGGILVHLGTAQPNGQMTFQAIGNTISGMYNGIVCSNGSGITLENNVLMGQVNDGVLDSGCINVFTSLNHVYRQGNASFEGTNGSGWLSTRDEIYGSTYGVLLDPSGGPTFGPMTFKSIIDWTSSDGFLINPDSSSKVMDIRIDADEWITAYSYVGPTNYGGYGVNILAASSGGVDGVDITGLIRDCYKAGIHISQYAKNVYFHDLALSSNWWNNTAGAGVVVDAGASYWGGNNVVCGATGGDGSDTGYQSACVSVAPGSSTAWWLRGIHISGGVAGSGITGAPMLVFPGGVGSVTGYYNFDLTGGGNYNNAGSSQTYSGLLIASGTISALSNVQVNLGNALSTPNLGGGQYGWGIHGEFRVGYGYPPGGSDGYAIIDVVKTDTGAIATIRTNYAPTSAYSLSVSGSTLTITDNSSRYTCGYWITQVKNDSTL